jgi:glycosyltransferase involved in cell wall biosynthesis
VDTGVFQPSDKPCFKQEVNILCVGRLIERKGQQHLLRAFADLRTNCEYPVTLTLVGTGDIEPLLRRLAEDLEVSHVVNFIGVISSEEMPRVYRQADVFVLPSQNEGMAISLLEAMAAGLPVVVTDTGGTAELVQEDANGLIVPWQNVDALSKSLAMLVRDGQARGRMGRQSRLIATRFSWSAVADKYLELCSQIVDGIVPTSGFGQR